MKNLTDISLDRFEHLIGGRIACRLRMQFRDGDGRIRNLMVSTVISGNADMTMNEIFELAKADAIETMHSAQTALSEGNLSKVAETAASNENRMLRS